MVCPSLEQSNLLDLVDYSWKNGLIKDFGGKAANEDINAYEEDYFTSQ